MTNFETPSKPLLGQDLPLEELRMPIIAALAQKPRCILSAPPGSGKSTRLPLWLLDAYGDSGQIYLLEPRRMVARALARYLAKLLGEKVGEKVGLLMRGVRKLGEATKLVVLTDGVLTRLLLADPELKGVACLIFDEVHERSLQVDLGLALALDSQEALRPDLKIVLMSATLEGLGLDRLKQASIFKHEQKTFPVECRWLPKPKEYGTASTGLLLHLAKELGRLIAKDLGTILVFLPGLAEINKVASLLEEERILPKDYPIYLLSRKTPLLVQDEILRPASSSRLILATSIAESALTIPDVRVVVDSGLSRFGRYDEGLNRTILVTERASLSTITQRQGRLGRTAPGLCLKLFSKESEQTLPAHTPSEISRADLSQLVLTLSGLGLVNLEQAKKLFWLNDLPNSSYLKARANLQSLGLLTKEGYVTKLGQDLWRYPLSPKTALILACGQKLGLAETACAVSALVDGQEQIKEAAFDQALAKLKEGAANFSELRAQARQLGLLCLGSMKSADFWARVRTDSHDLSRLLLQAWPKMVAKREAILENHGLVSYKLSSGSLVYLNVSEPICRFEYLLVLGVSGQRSSSRLRLALPLNLELTLDFLTKHATTLERCEVHEGLVNFYQEECYGALVLSQKKLSTPSKESCRKLLVNYLTKLGEKSLNLLPWSNESCQWQARVLFLRRTLGEPWPDLSFPKLLAKLDLWLGPYLEEPNSLKKLQSSFLLRALKTNLPRNLWESLDKLAPEFWLAPSGRKHLIDYQGSEGPRVAVKLQECFGLRAQPRLASGQVPLSLALLSPSARILQITSDLPHFWATTYAEVRREMRGRYPKHPWPEDPLTAEASVKPLRKKREL